YVPDVKPSSSSYGARLRVQPESPVGRGRRVRPWHSAVPRSRPLWNLSADSDDLKLPRSHSGTSLVPCTDAPAPTEVARSSGSRQKRLRATTAACALQGSEHEAEVCSSATAERRKLLVEDGPPQPLATDEQLPVPTENMAVLSGVHVGPFLGEVACFSSRTPVPPWPAGYVPYAAPAFNQSHRTSSTTSPHKQQR
ncbi:hypothetical protein MTO96_032388, partial [Rhipicephalus appendiculatus]